MSKPFVTDELWAAIEPLLPVEPSKRRGARPRCDDRAALSGIVFVLCSGIPWTMLPVAFGCFGMAPVQARGRLCWRRLRDWQAAGVWDRLHRVLLERLAAADELDWSRASLDSAAVAAKRGDPRRGCATGRAGPATPTGRADGATARGCLVPDAWRRPLRRGLCQPAVPGRRRPGRAERRRGRARAPAGRGVARPARPRAARHLPPERHGRLLDVRGSRGPRGLSRRCWPAGSRTLVGPSDEQGGDGP